MRAILTLCVFTPLFAAHASAQRPRMSAADSTAVVVAAAKFHASLATADSAAALALLTDDVQIVESGGVETRADYREHHLPADIAYAKSVTSVRTVQSVIVEGDAAWLVATSVTTGQANGRAVNSQGAELMVFRRTAQGWRIAAIHWSSRARRS
jgi:ketosteroid isomerase-like protein